MYRGGVMCSANRITFLTRLLLYGQQIQVQISYTYNKMVVGCANLIPFVMLCQKLTLY